MNTAMQSLTQLLSQKRDQSHLHLAQAQRVVSDAQQQLNDLQSYVDQTTQQWQRRTAAPMSAQAFIGQQEFSNGLQRAIALQTQWLEQHQQRVVHCLDAVHASEQRLGTLNKLGQARVKATRARQQRREQKQSDDFALMARARSQGLPSALRS